MCPRISSGRPFLGEEGAASEREWVDKEGCMRTLLGEGERKGGTLSISSFRSGVSCSSQPSQLYIRAALGISCMGSRARGLLFGRLSDGFLDRPIGGLGSLSGGFGRPRSRRERRGGQSDSFSGFWGFGFSPSKTKSIISQKNSGAQQVFLLPAILREITPNSAPNDAKPARISGSPAKLALGRGFFSAFPPGGPHYLEKSGWKAHNNRLNPGAKNGQRSLPPPRP